MKYKDGFCYLPRGVWETHFEKLKSVLSIFNRMCKQYSLRRHQDAKWLAAGIERRRIFSLQRLRMVFNPDYMDNHEETYLLIYDCFKLNWLGGKRLKIFEIIGKYCPDDIMDEKIMKRLILDSYKKYFK